MFKLGMYAWPYPTKELPSSLTVDVPLCYLPNSKVQTFAVQTMRRSLFQIEYLAQVAQSPNFAYFVTVRLNGKDIIVNENEHGPFTVFWYTRDGSLHFALLDRRIEIRKSTIPGSYVIPLDSEVYTSRTQ